MAAGGVASLEASSLAFNPAEAREYPFNFYVEDTSERCYRDVIGCLSQLGWKRVQTYRKRSKVEKRRLPAKNLPLLIWTLNEKDVDFADLETFQLCNHFEGISQLTTKRGFCELLCDMHWISQDSHEISPRCYNLGDPLHREIFEEEFKIGAAIMVLRHCLMVALDSSSSGNSGTFVVPSSVRKSCLGVCSRFLRIKRSGDWPGVQRNFEAAENDTGQINIYGTDSSPEWAAILSISYILAERAGGNRGAGGGNGDKVQTMLDSWKILYSRMVKNNQGQADATAIPPGHADTVTVFRIWLVLRGMQSINKQSAIDGHKNLWVVKAPEACRGLGLKVLHRLEDILECERGMGGRSVQKYVENPLLAPSVIQTVAPPAPIKSPNRRSPSREQSGGSSRYHNSHHDRHHTHQTTSAPAVPISMMKFDIRVWVLVSSFEPLQAHVFSRVYGRRCGLPYDDSTKNLGESLIHLTNYSIQRKSQAVVDGGAGTGETTTASVSSHLTASTMAAAGGSSVKKLRNVCDSSRGDGVVPPGKAAPASQGDLLMHHEEILQVVNNQGSASSRAGSPAGGDGKWGRDVWPEIKRKIVATLEATKSQVTHRERSFEFLGYDIILDDDLTPWILEVNMSPAMAHRSAAQNSLIASMINGLVNVAILPITGTAERDDNAGGAFCAEYFQDTAEEGFGVSEGEDGSQESILPVNAIVDFASAGGEWETLAVPPPLPSQPVLAQRGALTASASAASSAYNRQTAERPMSSAQALRNRVINEWSEGVPLNAHQQQQGTASARPRPKSASGTPRNTSASSQGGAGGNNFDVSFAAVGRAVNLRSIDFHDAVCDGFGSLLLLQAWARRYVARLRLYHEKRRIASTCMQTRVRSFLAKCKRYHLLRAKAAIALQCFSRSCAAWRHRVFLRSYRASTRIQTRFRGLAARRLLVKLRRDGAATRIQRWQAHCLDKWRRKAAFKIVAVGRAWLAWRRQNARRVFHLVALNYRRRFRARCQISRGVGRWFRRRKELQQLRRNWAEMAARKGREWTLAAMERRKRWDQAVSVKLEIIMYNTIYEMATEMAVEVYAEAVREAAEEEAVAAAAEEERALAMKEIINATFHASQDAVPHNYSELLASLPFGSEVMRSPCTARSAGVAGMAGMQTLDDFILEFNATGRARSSAVASRVHEEDEDDDDEDGLLGTKLLVDAESAPPVPRRNASPPFSSSSTMLPPPLSPSPGKERELSTLRSMAASFDSKSITLEREMRLRLLNLATDPATPAADSASAAAPSFQEPAKSKSAKPYYSTAKPAAVAHSAPHHSPAAGNKKVRPKSASAVNVKASRHPFPPNVYGHGQESWAGAKRSTTTTAVASSQFPSQGPADPPAKSAKKRSKASSGTHGPRGDRNTATAAPWEQDVMCMNPYTFMGGFATPPSLDFGLPFPIHQRGGAGSSIGIGSMSHSWSTQPQPQPRREAQDPDVAVYSAATTHLETERSILLSKMLTSLLEKHEDSRSQVFRAAALPLAGYDGYEQEYSFQSTAKAGKKRGGGW